MVEYDVARFEQELSALLDRTDPDPAALDRALARYRGTFMAGENPAAWRQNDEDRLRRLYCDGALRLGELHEQAGRVTEAVAISEAALSQEPILEEAHRRLMRLWAASGERLRALRHYERLNGLLRDQLQVDPEDETVALYDQLRAAAPGGCAYLEP